MFTQRPVYERITNHLYHFFLIHNSTVTQQNLCRICRPTSVLGHAQEYSQVSAEGNFASHGAKAKGTISTADHFLLPTVHNRCYSRPRIAPAIAENCYILAVLCLFSYHRIFDVPGLIFAKLCCTTRCVLKYSI